MTLKNEETEEKERLAGIWRIFQASIGTMRSERMPSNFSLNNGVHKIWDVIFSWKLKMWSWKRKKIKREIKKREKTKNKRQTKRKIREMMFEREMRTSHFISYRKGYNLLEAWSTRFGEVVIGMAIISFLFIPIIMHSFSLFCQSSDVIFCLVWTLRVTGRFRWNLLFACSLCFWFSFFLFWYLWTWCIRITLLPTVSFTCF